MSAIEQLRAAARERLVEGDGSSLLTLVGLEVLADFLADVKRIADAAERVAAAPNAIPASEDGDREVKVALYVLLCKHAKPADVTRCLDVLDATMYGGRLCST